MKDILFLFFMVFDPWRVLVPAGLSVILLVSPWLAKGNPKSPYTLVQRVLSQLTGKFALYLFGFTGLLGFCLSWFPFFVNSSLLSDGGLLGWLEVMCYGGGVFCLWKVQQVTALGERPFQGWPWLGCILFLGALSLWILKWDEVVYGGSAGIGGGVSSWDWPRLLSKGIHVLLSALAVGGLVVILLGAISWTKGKKEWNEHLKRRQQEEECRIQVVRFGMAWVLGGVVPQVVVGSWLMVALGEDVRNHFLNGLTLGSFIFFSSLLLALLGLVLINAAFIAPQVKGLVWGGWTSILCAIFLMGFIRYDTLGVAVASWQTEGIWFPLSVWHLLLSVLPLVALLAFLLKALSSALIFHGEKPTE